MPYKNNDFTVFFAIESIEIPQKTLFKSDRECGRTVGSGRVATIIE